MIKDYELIREQLCGFVEVDMPDNKSFDFPLHCDVKYIMMKDNDESFYPGGKFIRRCNDYIILKSDISQWSVPICNRDKNGTILYKSRFFVPENINILSGGGKKKEDKETSELNKTIQFQQTIIDKLTARLKDIEIQKYNLVETNENYEELLQNSRFKLKELALELKEKTNKINHYEELIPKIYNSR